MGSTGAAPKPPQSFSAREPRLSTWTARARPQVRPCFRILCKWDPLGCCGNPCEKRRRHKSGPPANSPSLLSQAVTVYDRGTTHRRCGQEENGTPARHRLTALFLPKPARPCNPRQKRRLRTALRKAHGAQLRAPWLGDTDKEKKNLSRTCRNSAHERFSFLRTGSRMRAPKWLERRFISLASLWAHRN